MIIRVALPFVLALGLVDCGGDRPPLSGAMTSTSAHPTAKEVAVALKQAGVPFLDDFGGVALPVSGDDVGTTYPAAAGILSTASTVTEVASVRITVFSTREKLEQARRRQQAATEQMLSISYFADLRSILVSLDTDDGKANATVKAQAEQIQAALKANETTLYADR
jgi:hypothetical protein